MKKQLKSLLRKAGIVAVSDQHRALGYLENFPHTSFHNVLYRVFPRLEGLTFLQIGANDGKRFDPIHELIVRYQWRGVLVEPVADIFRSLTETYRGCSGLRFLQAAVDIEQGSRTIYRLNANCLESLPEWAMGLATFNRHQLVETASKLGVSESSIVSEDVVTVSWAELWALLPSSRCDVLVIDTEGHDVPLLNQAGLEKHRPRIVHFEHALTSVPDRLSFYGKLLDYGYQFTTDENDTTAWLAA
jgi:FkbM family methyltransferase